ncbi:hypothetical protein P3T39_006769 [Kitasatospora sp. GP82]|nr:hypothetical protein [Kitasatospora sp. GP82]
MLREQGRQRIREADPRWAAMVEQIAKRAPRRRRR